MTPVPGPQPRRRRYRARHQARLDAETHATLEELASGFCRKRAAILRCVMRWGLAHTQAWTVDPSSPDHPHLVHVLVAPELGQLVQDAAAGCGVSMAAWVRQAMRQVTPSDFPNSWRDSNSASRSHESRYFRRKFGLRLDEVTSQKLDALTQTFNRSAAEIIRQLAVQANVEDFPPSWRMAVEERRAREARSDT